MKKSMVICTVFLFQILLPLLPDSADAFSIALSVKERAGVNRIDEPVTYGVPFSRAMNVMGTGGLQVVRSDGSTQVPAQFRVLSRYDGTPADTTKPIRVVLVDFQTDITADQTDTYYLKDGGSGTVSGVDLASEDSSYVTLSTGALIVKISKTSFNLFDQVFIDKDNDGSVTDNIVSSNPGDGIVVNYNGTDYTSYNSTPTVVIEENGPLRAVVKATGYFEDSGNNRLLPPLGDRGLTFTVRFIAYKDASFVKVDFTLENENKAWTTKTSEPVHNIYINSVYLRTTIALNSSKTVQFDGYSDNFTTAGYTLLQEHQENAQAESSNFVYSIAKNGGSVENGARYEGLADIRDADKGLMISSRWFWQNWPKSIEVNNNVIDYYLWPDIAADHRILGGIYKTHELIYNFHGAVSGGYGFDAEMAALKKRLTAKASGQWFAQSDFFGPMIPANVTSAHTFAAGEMLQEAINEYNDSIRAKYDASYADLGTNATFFSLREARPLLDSAGGDYLNWYGWLWFGDTPRGINYGYSAQHYAWDYISLVNSLRFNDDDMFDIGEEFVSHKADIIVMHDSQGAAWPASELIYHGGQRYEQDALLSYNDEYSTSLNGGPSRSSHFWTKGLILQYFLTGNQRYYDTILQSGFHLKYVYLDVFSCDTMECNLVETRNQSRAINNLADIYKATGDESYLDAAYDIFVNGLLTIEGPSNAGWFNFDPYGDPDCCGGTACNAHLLYDGISSEALINLYYVLNDKGSTTEANNVKGFLERQANWVKSSIYTNWTDGTCGSYRNNNTEYFPYSVKNDWKNGASWSTGSGCIVNGLYSMYFADTFAFMFRESGDMTWMNLARNVFKDFKFYGDNDGVWSTVKSASFGTSGFLSVPNSAYLKFGGQATKPLFYLRTEWILQSLAPSAPENLHIEQ